MRKDFRVFSSIALTVLMAISAVLSLAQRSQPAPDRAKLERELIVRATSEDEIMIAGPQGPGGPRDFTFLSTEMSVSGKLVKGAPYSAEAVTENVQTFTDGNRIINKSTGAVYRDGEGRTRREQTLKAIGPFATGGEAPVTVFINDPVAGASYTLDPRTQTARIMPMRIRVANTKPATGELKSGKTEEPEVRNSEGERQVMLERSPSPDAVPYKAAVESAAANDKRSTGERVTVGVASSRDRIARSESLGKQNVGGVEAEGTRSVWTIPAGEVGNERPIEIVSERWYSPELQVIVMMRHTDPRFGESTYQLTNINRSEPSRDLFEVPPGYTVKETSSVPMTTQGSGINGGVLNGKATSLPTPDYPAIARQAKATGTVAVQITIDEGGNVIMAEAVSGHPLLRAAAVRAARNAKFSPTRLSGQPVKVNGVLTYTFAMQ